MYTSQFHYGMHIIKFDENLYAVRENNSLTCLKLYILANLWQISPRLLEKHSNLTSEAITVLQQHLKLKANREIVNTVTNIHKLLDELVPMFDENIASHLAVDGVELVLSQLNNKNEIKSFFKEKLYLDIDPNTTKLYKIAQ